MSSVYDKAVFLCIPSGYKATKLYGQVPNTTDGDLTVARNSVAYRVDPDLALEEMAVNVPRLDYTGGGCPKFITEEQRTNLFLNSAVGVTQNITVTSGVAYTMYFLSGAGTITLSDAATEVISVSDYDLSGAVTFTTSSTTLTCTVAGVANLVQCELGAYPSTYIVTAGASATRLKDAVTGGGSQSTFTNVNTSGVLYWEATAHALNTGVNSEIQLHDGTVNNYINLYYQGSSTGNITASNNIGGSSDVLLQYTIDQTVNHKVAVRYALNNYSLWIDGVKVLEDIVSASVPSAGTFTTLDFDNAISTRPFYAKLKGVGVFEYLTDTEMATLTT